MTLQSNAIYSQAIMRAAAFGAGLLTSEDDARLTFVLEPEAATTLVGAMILRFLPGSSYSHGPLTPPPLFRRLKALLDAPEEEVDAGSTVMVVDAGGGTVDIVVAHVTSMYPFKIEIMAKADGGPWGGKEVNARFFAFLRDLVPSRYHGAAFRGLALNEVATNFEQAKSTGACWCARRRRSR